MTTTFTGTNGSDAFVGPDASGISPSTYNTIRVDDWGDIINPLGGTDYVAAGDGIDVINFGQYLTSADYVDGGAGYDTLTLNGDYSNGLALTGATIRDIEEFQLAAGHSYKLYLADSVVADTSLRSTIVFTVDASKLGATNSLRLDASAEKAVGYNVTGGAGNDTIVTGSGNDTINTGGGANFVNAGAGDDNITTGTSGSNTIYGGSGSNIYGLNDAHDVCYGGADRDLFQTTNFSVNDHFDGGGGGDDALIIQAKASASYVFNAQTMVNVETLLFESSQTSFSLKLNDANVAAGKTLTVNLSDSPGINDTFDGSAETDGRFDIWTTTNGKFIGGAGNDGFHVDPAISNVDGGGGYNTVFVQYPYTVYDIALTATALKNVQALVLPGSSYALGLTMNDANVAAGKPW